MKQYIYTNNYQTLVIREELNAKGNPVVITIVDGRKREHNSITAEEMFDKFCNFGFKLIDRVIIE